MADPGAAHASLARTERPGLDARLPWLIGIVLALLVLAPLLRPSYVLSYDLVFVPHPAVNFRSLGLDGSVPRAVPGDFVVAVLGSVVPAWLVELAALVAVPVLAAVGAWRLSPATTLPGAAVSAVLYAWNPYVAERLAIGHWSLLLGYAMLPWLVRSGLRLVRGEVTAGWSLVAWTGACAAAAPTSAVLGTLLALGFVALSGAPLRGRLTLLTGLLLVNLPWLLPGALTASTTADAAAGVLSFAARADTPAGGVLSVLTSGGIWNALVASSNRSAWASVAISLGLLALAALGIRHVVRRWGLRGSTVVIAVSLLGLLIALASLTPPGRDLLTWLVRTLPGAGLLRDAQKWLAWWCLLVAAAAGPGAEVLLSRVAHLVRTPVLVGIALLPLVAMPSLAWGVGGQLRSADWPVDFAGAAAAVNRSTAPGAAVVLPWHAFRSWSWNHGRTTLDPWPRLLDRRVLVNDDLELRQRTVPGEDPLARRVSELIAADRLTPAALRGVGVRYVVLDRRTVGQDASSRALRDAGATTYDGPQVVVRDLGPVAADPAPRWWLLVPDGLALATLLAVVCVALRGATRRRR